MMNVFPACSLCRRKNSATRSNLPWVSPVRKTTSSDLHPCIISRQPPFPMSLCYYITACAQIEHKFSTHLLKIFRRPKPILPHSFFGFREVMLHKRINDIAMCVKRNKIVLLISFAASNSGLIIIENPNLFFKISLCKE